MSTQIRVLKTDGDHAVAVARLSELMDMDPAAGSAEDAVDLARQRQIHPAIIAGRVRKETENWRLLSNLISSAGKVSDLFNNQLACQ